MSSVPWIHSVASTGRPAAAPYGTGRVSIRDPDGGRHLLEVVARGSAADGPGAYQVKVDGWCHVAWASSPQEVQSALDRVRRAIVAGWLPGDADLPA